MYKFKRDLILTSNWHYNVYQLEFLLKPEYFKLQIENSNFDIGLNIYYNGITNPKVRVEFDYIENVCSLTVYNITYIILTKRIQLKQILIWLNSNALFLFVTDFQSI